MEQYCVDIVWNKIVIRGKKSFILKMLIYSSLFCFPVLSVKLTKLYDFVFTICQNIRKINLIQDFLWRGVSYQMYFWLKYSFSSKYLFFFKGCLDMSTGKQDTILIKKIENNICNVHGSL